MKKEPVHSGLLLLLLASLVFGALSIVISLLVTRATFVPLIVSHIEKKVHHKEVLLEKWMHEAYDNLQIDQETFNEKYNELLRRHLEKEEMSLYIYRNDSLIFWSDNKIPEESIPRQETTSVVQFGGTGWYISKPWEQDNFRFVGLIILGHQYPLTNRFLRKSYFRGSWLGDHFEIVSIPEAGAYPVYNSDGEYCFGIRVSDQTAFPLFWNWIAFLLFLSGILMGSYTLFRYLRVRGSVGQWTTLLLLFLLYALIGMIIAGRFLPANFYELPLFSPFYFALSSWCPSIGDLFLLSLLFYLFVYGFHLVMQKVRDHRLHSVGLLILMFLITIVLAASVELIYRLVINSSLAFEPHRILQLNIFSILGFISVGLIYLSFLILSDVFLAFFGSFEFRKLILPGAISLLLILLLQLPSHAHIPIITVFILWFQMGILYWLRRRSVSLSIFISAVMIGLFSMFLILHYSEEARTEKAKLLAVNLAAEHDPVAELLMEDLDGKLLQDLELKEIMKKDIFTQTDVDLVYQYLKRTYFNAYWDKYDLSVILCTPVSDLIVDEEVLPCKSFFDTLIIGTGSPVGNTRFHYLNTQNGLTSYLAEYRFAQSGGYDTNALYLQLDSKILYEQLGYPELLIGERHAFESVPAEFSYAKYFNGNLVAQNGNYAYPVTDEIFGTSSLEFNNLTLDGFRHIVYYPNKNSSIVLSYRYNRLYDYIISFSYLFIFFFLISLIFLYRTVFPVYVSFESLMLKQKIQLWFFSLMIFIFCLVGAGTVYMTKKQFDGNHLANLKEKLQSVYVELEHKLSFESSLDKNWSSAQYASLNDLLVKFSNVFFTDINLYDEDGRLLATSRPEIFELHLLSPRMNEEAFFQLSHKKVSEFVHNESIGRLKFLSAYTPFFNQDKKFLAYLNLPYFTKQNLLTREISNMIVAILNSWMVLILISFALAVLISDKITNPLKQLQEKIGSFKLGTEYEHIHYDGQDEIGDLVQKYNRMIDELDKNVQLLAKSERESAWREMARQIAHEIKNPLTPMKLSVQQLRRSWQDKRKDFPEKLDQVSKTLIEQIERLSRIATAFSNFARLPKTQYTPVRIESLVRETVALFGGDPEVTLELPEGNLSDIQVYADREELYSVLVNLLKNAEQSVPEGRIREIGVRLWVEAENKAMVISVWDNGTGIPAGMEEKLFEPNFTTKSSGMGLGLSIARKIIEDIGGSIWYEPNKPVGTIFHVRLPVFEGEGKNNGP